MPGSGSGLLPGLWARLRVLSPKPPRTATAPFAGPCSTLVPATCVLAPCLLTFACLANPPPLQETPTPALPLYTEEWVEELISRCFAIITNLDSPEHRGGCCMLRMLRMLRMLWLHAWGFLWRLHFSGGVGCCCQPCQPACLPACLPAALPLLCCVRPLNPLALTPAALPFMALSPLCAGEHGGQGQKLAMEEGSFLLDSNSMFRCGGRYCGRYCRWYCAPYCGVYCCSCWACGSTGKGTACVVWRALAKTIRGPLPPLPRLLNNPLGRPAACCLPAAGP